jgi:ketosteroid isomerase-like protein
MNATAEELAATYFDAWRDRDFGRLRAILADDVDFAGPFASIRGADECVRGLEGLARITTGIDIRKVFVDGNDTLTWYDLSTSVAETVPVANWIRAADGRITRIRVAFDARGLAGAR